MKITVEDMRKLSRKKGGWSEHQHQRRLIKHCNDMLRLYPKLRLIFAIPNGGARDAITGAQLKAEGVKPGVPDLFLPVARGEFHGLFIEMKAGQNGASEEQEKWHADLRAERFRVEVCYSWMEASKVLEAYLAKEQTR